MTADEFDGPPDLPIRSWRIPGPAPTPARRSSCRTAGPGTLVFDIPTLIEYVSASITLEPGDIISTGHAGRRRRLPRPAGLPRARATASGSRSRGSAGWRIRSSTSTDARSALNGLPEATDARPREDRRPAPVSSLREVPQPDDRHQRRPHPGPARPGSAGPTSTSRAGTRGRPGRSIRRSSSATSSSARSSRSAAT